MYFKGLTFIFSEDPPENHLKVIGGLLLKYYVLLLLLYYLTDISYQNTQSKNEGKKLTQVD